MAPKHDLAVVRAAALEGRVELDERRARDEVLRFISEFVAAYAFASDVLCALQPEGYAETIELQPPHAGSYDVYGLELAPSIAQRHGVPDGGWYVKLRLYESFEGETVFLVSLHPLEHDLECSGGTVKKKESP